MSELREAGRESLVAYFEARVIRGEGCWGWSGHIDKNGYAWASARGYHSTAHRLSYELAVGEIPDGLHVDHLCRNPSCVNPAHLEPVTLAENVRRGVGVTARNRRKTHCPKGHEYSGANLIVRKVGSRQCATCRLESNARVRRKKGVPRGRLRHPLAEYTI